MTTKDNYLKNLPKVDENREIQTNSFDALNSFIPKNSFCIRDERIEDYGVDASLEILSEGVATNFRAQIQLKGTRSLEPNTDGSYSLQVDTHNLHYLLNNSSSIYILYIEPEDEFRFVWARDEFQRFEEKNPDWINQETVTLRFNDILDLIKLDEIKEQIIKHSSLNRTLSETLILSESPNVLLEINSDTFEITDKKEIFNLITGCGINLVNEGYRKEILEKINLLDTEDREKTSVLIVKAYVEYSLGHYHIAKEIVLLILVSDKELSEKNQQIAKWLECVCDYQLGNINSKEYINKLGEITSNDEVESFSAFRFQYLHRLLLDEENYERRKKIIVQLRDEVKKLSQEESIKENFLLFNYQILEAELGTIVAEFSKSLAGISLRKRMRFYKDISDLSRDVANLTVIFSKRSLDWENEINEIFKNTENELLQADILVEKVLLIVTSASVVQFHTEFNENVVKEIDDELFERCKGYLDVAIETYSNLDLLERNLRAQSLLAELMSVKAKTEEADVIRSNVSNLSGKMSYAQVKASTEMPLSKIFERVMYEQKSIDFDRKWANSSDEEMDFFTQEIMTNLKLPQNRFVNLRKEVLANREINKEKLNWCEYIELIQDLEHTASSETYYAIDPERYGYCSKYGFESIFGSSDYDSIILRFKKNYCENCSGRKPKGN